MNETLIDLKEIIHTELSQRLTLTDQALKENLQKMVRSKVCKYIYSVTGYFKFTNHKILVIISKNNNKKKTLFRSQGRQNGFFLRKLVIEILN